MVLNSLAEMVHYLCTLVILIIKSIQNELQIFDEIQHANFEEMFKKQLYKY